MTPTPEQLTKWQNTLTGLSMLRKSGVCSFPHVHYENILEMSQLAGTQVTFGCPPCFAEDMRKLAERFKEYLP